MKKSTNEEIFDQIKTFIEQIDSETFKGIVRSHAKKSLATLLAVHIKNGVQGVYEIVPDYTPDHNGNAVDIAGFKKECDSYNTIPTFIIKIAHQCSGQSFPYRLFSDNYSIDNMTVQFYTTFKKVKVGTHDKQSNLSLKNFTLFNYHRQDDLKTFIKDINVDGFDEKNAKKFKSKFQKYINDNKNVTGQMMQSDEVEFDVYLENGVKLTVTGQMLCAVYRATPVFNSVPTPNFTEFFI